jgi:ribose 5-phosphate isomerase B
MTIAIGNDHAGTAYKYAIINLLKLAGYEVLNFGTDTEDSVDYPDHVHPVATAVSTQKASLGIIICGSGNGATMTANKHQNIRAALCWNKEIVALAKQHNNANILSLPARYISLPQALEMVQVYLDTSFEGGRHATRVNKIACK